MGSYETRETNWVQVKEWHGYKDERERAIVKARVLRDESEQEKAGHFAKPNYYDGRCHCAWCEKNYGK